MGCLPVGFFIFFPFGRSWRPLLGAACPRRARAEQKKKLAGSEPIPPSHDACFFVRQSGGSGDGGGGAEKDQDNTDDSHWSERRRLVEQWEEYDEVGARVECVHEVLGWFCFGF